MSEGDHVNDLYIVLQGCIEIMSSRPASSSSLVCSTFSSDDVAIGDIPTGSHWGRRQV